ncbi:hypothetical protein GWC92_13155 [Aeromonas caviae]|uniref:hypothetical protein n=1 Tax=Aeromonas caviae TaxID=648 RepID=UPI0015DDDEFB|nr:hypothetical protein [Aeromonas caviae]QLL81180.1 hypothetical protein GWC92_13155 [Aeromonas caviae]
MKHLPTIIAAIGVLLVGVVIGLTISDIYSSNTPFISIISSLIQSCIGGFALLMAYLTYRSWKRQLLYPRYIEAMEILHTEFHAINQRISDYRDLDGGAFDTILNEWDTNERIFGKYRYLSDKHAFLIRRFAPEATAKFMSGDAVFNNYRCYIEKLNRAKNEPYVPNESAVCQELYRYICDYNKHHDAGLP